MQKNKRNFNNLARGSLQPNQISREHKITVPRSFIDGPKTLTFHNKPNITMDSTFNMYPPIDVFMTPSFIQGKATHGKPLQVFTSEIDPIYKVTHKEKGEEVYGYEDFSEKEGYKNALKNFERNHGMIYFYSKNKLLKAEMDQIKKETNSIQMLVCVTMYGEPRAFLENTLSSIASNLPNFAKLGISQKQIVVIVLQDGIMKMKEEMVEFYSEQDSFLERKYYLQERRFMIEQQVNYLKLQKKEQSIAFNNGLPTTIPTKTALLYQNEITFNKSDKLVTFSVFKHLNGKKLSSHLWFFEGFCRQFQPKYCALVDVGTLPANDGLVQMYKALEGDCKIGGVCGFMGLKAPVIQQSELTEEEQNQMKAQIAGQISEYKKKHFWIDKEYEKKLQEEKMRITLAQPGRASKKMSFAPQFNALKSESNVNPHVSLNEQLRIEKKKRKYTTDLIIIFNVFFLVQSLLLLIYKVFMYVIMFCFKIIVWILKSFLNIASLPQAQNYEYTTAHMIDKNFESALGFLHVLPGAWSSYRYKALNLSKENRENLIQKRYLKQIMYSELMTNNIQELNMFLAEDRILCLGIYCQLESNFYLKFIPDAKAFTDPVDKFEEFLNQRRRWINSSWFALNYVLQNYEFHVEESSHSEFSKRFMLPFNMTFAQISKWTTYFIPALYLFVSILSSYQFLQPSITSSYAYIKSKEQFDLMNDLDCSEKDEEPYPMCIKNLKEHCFIACATYEIPNVFFTLLNFVPAIFVVVILLIIFASLVFKPKDVEISDDEEKLLAELNSKVKKGVVLTAERKKLRNEISNKLSQRFQNDVFKVLASIISLTSLIVVLIVTATIFFNAMNNSYGIIKGFKKLKSEYLIYIYVMIGINYGSFYLSVLVHLRQPFIVWNVIKSFLSYQIYAPIYNHILMIFSFCNIDDATWGTKGLTGSTGVSKQYTEKIEFVGKWILLNAFLLTVLLVANLINSSTPLVIMGLGAFGSIYFFIKTMIGIWHYLKYFYFDKIKYWYRNKGNKKFYVEYSRQLDSVFNKVLNTHAMMNYQTPQQSMNKDVMSEEVDYDDDESNPMTPQHDRDDNDFQDALTDQPTKNSPKERDSKDSDSEDGITSEQSGRIIKKSAFAVPNENIQPIKSRNLKKKQSEIQEEQPNYDDESEESIKLPTTQKSHIRFQNDEIDQKNSGPPGPKIKKYGGDDEINVSDEDKKPKNKKVRDPNQYKSQNEDDDEPEDDSMDEGEKAQKLIGASRMTHTQTELVTKENLMTNFDSQGTINDIEIQMLNQHSSKKTSIEVHEENPKKQKKVGESHFKNEQNSKNTNSKNRSKALSNGSQ